MAKQIFGYTPSQPAGDQYVRYIAVFENDDGDVVIHVRNPRGIVNEIIVPRAEAFDMAKEIAKHAQPETTV